MLPGPVPGGGQPRSRPARTSARSLRHAGRRQRCACAPAGAASWPRPVAASSPNRPTAYPPPGAVGESKRCQPAAQGRQGGRLQEQKNLQAEGARRAGIGARRIRRKGAGAHRAGTALLAPGARTNSWPPCCSPTPAWRPASPSTSPWSADGRPQQKNLLQVLHEWIEFRFLTVEGSAPATASPKWNGASPVILEGVKAAFLRIDKVIKVIRQFRRAQARPDLKFLTSPTSQAEDILEIRLRQLARLEGIKDRNGSLPNSAKRKASCAPCSTPRPEMTQADPKGRSPTTPNNTATRAAPCSNCGPHRPGRGGGADEPVTVILSERLGAHPPGHGIAPDSIGYKAGASPSSSPNSHDLAAAADRQQGPRLQRQKSPTRPAAGGDGVADRHADRAPGTAAGWPRPSAPTPKPKYLFAGSGGYGLPPSGRSGGSQQGRQGLPHPDDGEKPLKPAPPPAPPSAPLAAAGKLLPSPPTCPEMARAAATRSSTWTTRTNSSPSPSNYTATA